MREKHTRLPLRRRWGYSCVEGACTKRRGVHELDRLKSECRGLNSKGWRPDRSELQRGHHELLQRTQFPKLTDSWNHLQLTPGRSTGMRQSHHNGVKLQLWLFRRSQHNLKVRLRIQSIPWTQLLVWKTCFDRILFNTALQHRKI